MVLDPYVQELENVQEASFGFKADKRSQVAGDLSVTEDNLMCKKIEVSSFLVENNPNYRNFDIGSENFSFSNLENADSGILPDFFSFASEDDSLLNWLGQL